MNKFYTIILVAIMCSTSCAETPPPESSALKEIPSSNTPEAPKTISIQEMLVIGNSDMRQHALSMLIQTKADGQLDESYIPGLKACSEDPSPETRRLTVKVLGQSYVSNADNPNSEIVELLIKLAKDDSAEVQHLAIADGLTQIKNKSDAAITQLLEIAATTRERKVFDLIVPSLLNDRDQVKQLLDRRLAENYSSAMYDLYEKATGQKPPPRNTFLDQQSLTIQETLATGSSGMRLHALSMINQGKLRSGVNESFLPYFKLSAQDPAAPVRSITARVVGQYMVANRDKPLEEAVLLLMQLARDESADVRFSAIYHGLTQIRKKSDAVIILLTNVAAEIRDHVIYERIGLSLADQKEQVMQILNEQLETGNNAATFEIYKDMTGEFPPLREKYLEMPCSRPRLFVFKGEENNSETQKADLLAELDKVGIPNPDLFATGSGANHVLLLTTRITRDRLTVEKHFPNHNTFTVTQTMWLTPEMEIEIDALRDAAK